MYVDGMLPVIKKVCPVVFSIAGLNRLNISPKILVPMLIEAGKINELNQSH